MKTIDEIIYDEFEKIPVHESSWYGQYLVARERERMFEEKLSPELHKEYVDVTDEQNYFEHLRLRDLCKFTVEYYKKLVK